jgi:hypothetical protein
MNKPANNVNQVIDEIKDNYHRVMRHVHRELLMDREYLESENAMLKARLQRRHRLTTYGASRGATERLRLTEIRRHGKG